MRPTTASCWARQGKPDSLPATYRRNARRDLLPRLLLRRRRPAVGRQPPPKGTANTLAALKSIRAARPDGAPIHIIWDNLSAHTGADIRRWAKKNKTELCFTPTYASWADPIEAHFGPLRQFTLASSNHPNHTVRTWALHAYLRWRNAKARHPDILPAQRRERARVRSEKGSRWGGRPLAAAA
ncbi:transposase [Streptomyces griseoluteus]|uniref:transposase n=1 Tax=Streptomyces griseoluteus TaxID=29306 RepID=UPI0037010D9C